MLPLLIAIGLTVTVMLIFMTVRSRGVKIVRTLDGVPQAAPPPGTMDDVSRLLADKQPIAAIKLYRELTGVGLKEAKDAVEVMLAGGTPASPAQRPVIDEYAPQAQELVSHIKGGRLIEAIKLYRELYGCDLKTAKDAVEDLAARLRSRT